jgi:hypothetical protein
MESITSLPVCQRGSPTRVAGLSLADTGHVIQFFTGVPGFPPVPPRPIISLVAAGVVALARSRWAPIVGLLAALFIAVSFLVAGGGPRLADPTEFGPFVGIWFQVVRLGVALIATVSTFAFATRAQRFTD